MKLIGKYSIAVWIGLTPLVIGDFDFFDWQAWVFIFGTNLLIELHKACL